MGAQVVNQQVNTQEEVFNFLKERIEQSEDKQVSVSSKEISQLLGISATTVDYHINKLLNQKRLVLLPKRGRYNLRTYTLPSKKVFNTEQHEEYLRLIQEGLKETQALEQKIKQLDESESSSLVSSDEEKSEDQTVTETDSSSKEQKGSSYVTDVINTDLIDGKDMNIKIQELSLDEQIERYLRESKNVASAEMLLSHEDREILSVMNETIAQTVVYLKDLSDQLSTIQNKQLIQRLIDERNENLERIKRLEEENRILTEQLKDNQEKQTIDPQRVRMMHQYIIATVDNYLDQPNHALALGRKEFREMISKQISDLVRYVLRLED